ncbi:PREDICTED: uncharacterized protein LOC104826422 [Tarenaya hassleriana]|uniref:uncharacterized protein LOC104826422 n=1 Tax=Tarenaya hassleriana TaxID=28532 RepID=UPI00053C187A|nr:PREDICTED: uncharacterized protein LOC104826422 [Tarenaya hassleriana]
MGEGDNLVHSRGHFVAPLTFFLVVLFRFLSMWLDQVKKKGSSTSNTREDELRSEIKMLLKEASSFSQPSTFAQAAKLRRLAAAKERELAKFQEQDKKEINQCYDLYGKVLLVSKVVIYISLGVWFWRTPIAIVSKQLVQPFGSFLSLGTGGHLNGHVMVGIAPWLILSTRVSKYVCRVVEF